VTSARQLKLAIQSLRCMARLRRGGARTGLVTCEGRLPSLTAGGEIRLGRVALRGRTACVELGAGPGARLEIGDRVFVNQGATLVAATSVRIGDDVRIGDFAGVYDTNHHPVEEGAPVRRAPVEIGDNAWLGRGAIVLPGSRIGEHAVVAAGSVVSGEVPPRTLVAGNPARPVRDLEASAGWRRP
jgi:acetyltransferase-like isoleucine patch superfamily enzyme